MNKYQERKNATVNAVLESEYQLVSFIDVQSVHHDRGPDSA